MSTTDHLVIDIETLSTQPNAVVTQFGYAVIRVHEGRLATVQDPIEPAVPLKAINVDQQAQVSQGRHICPDTVAWWMRQGQAARQSVFGITQQVASVENLRLLIETIIGVRKIQTVWAYGASFDFPILKSLFGGRTPWSYRQERCARTAIQMVDPMRTCEVASGGVPHNAQDDARHTALHLAALHNSLRMELR